MQDGWTALHAASLMGHKEVVTELLKYMSAGDIDAAIKVCHATVAPAVFVW